jgi:methylthioribulose 1-phosphate dehydratase/enolase-phosphatase E1
MQAYLKRTLGGGGGAFPPEVEEAKSLIAELCANLYSQGHVSGTGGGISIKVGQHIVMAPSGVQKERMQAADMFVLDAAGEVVHTPEARPPPHKAPKLSECAPLFMSVSPPPARPPPPPRLPPPARQAPAAALPAAATAKLRTCRPSGPTTTSLQAFELRNAGAVLHGHSMHALLATLLDPHATEFRITHVEMIKGIAGQGFYGTMVVPIIENTARECELTDRLRAAVAAYPASNAVLVRRHGVYVWGDTWVQAKTQFECYDYLFEAAVKMRQLGIDAARAPPPPPLPLPLPASAAANGHGGAAEPAAKRAKTQTFARLPTAIVLDIEGTVAPISFVAEVLFPYARARLRSHLESTFESAETQADLDLLRQLAEADAAAGTPQLSRPLPAAGADRGAVVDAAVGSCEVQMGADRKTRALKALQGHIWREGFASGALVAELYRDVPDALAGWRAAGVKTFVYSSGSRQAQRGLFGRTTVGDLRPYLCGFFDTTSGSKVSGSGGGGRGGAGRQRGGSDPIHTVRSGAAASPARRRPRRGAIQHAVPIPTARSGQRPATSTCQSWLHAARPSRRERGISDWSHSPPPLEHNAAHAAVRRASLTARARLLLLLSRSRPAPTPILPSRWELTTRLRSCLPPTTWKRRERRRRRGGARCSPAGRATPRCRRSRASRW